MESGFSSPRADDYAQAVHGETRSGWDEVTVPDSLRPGPGHTIDTGYRDREWEEVKPTHVHPDDNIPEIRAELRRRWDVTPFNIDGGPLFPGPQNRQRSVNNATERAHPTTDTQQPTASRANSGSRTRRRSTSQSHAAAGSRRGSASSNQSF
eukprot:1814936-Rhodomonas_salina.1